jgi:hypothetical protein
MPNELLTLSVCLGGIYAELSLKLKAELGHSSLIPSQLGSASHGLDRILGVKPNTRINSA